MVCCLSEHQLSESLGVGEYDYRLALMNFEDIVDPETTAAYAPGTFQSLTDGGSRVI